MCVIIQTIHALGIEPTLIKNREKEKKPMLLKMLNERHEKARNNHFQSNRLLDGYRKAFAQAMGALAMAQKQQKYTAYEDEHVKRKIAALQEQCHGLINTPQGFLDEMTALHAEQMDTARKRETAGARVQPCRQALNNAETAMRMEEATLARLQKDFADVLEEIHSVRAQSS
jgi:chromosome segregation ATPase